MRVRFVLHRVPLLTRLPSSDRARFTIALTFDDGPHPDSTPFLLSMLDRAGARASFFVTGERAQRWPELLQAIAAAGHGIFPHGWSHRRFDRLDEAEIVDELDRTEAILRRVRPTPSPYFLRLPHGSGHRDARLHRILRRWNPDCRLVHWSIDSTDYAIGAGNAAPDAIEREVEDRLRAFLAVPDLAGAIVLMHERPIGTNAHTGVACVRFAQRAIEALSARGHFLCSLAEVDARQRRSIPFELVPRTIRLAAHV